MYSHWKVYMVPTRFTPRLKGGGYVYRKHTNFLSRKHSIIKMNKTYSYVKYIWMCKTISANKFIFHMRLTREINMWLRLYIKDCHCVKLQCRFLVHRCGATYRKKKIRNTQTIVQLKNKIPQVSTAPGVQGVTNVVKAHCNY